MTTSISSGIYTIENLRTSRRYIGSSKNIERRFQEHKRQLLKNSHHCSALQLAWSTDGESNFEFKILKVCAEGDLAVQEQLEISLTQAPYNQTKTAARTGSTVAKQEFFESWSSQQQAQPLTPPQLQFATEEWRAKLNRLTILMIGLTFFAMIAAKQLPDLIPWFLAGLILTHLFRWRESKGGLARAVSRYQTKLALAKAGQVRGLLRI